MDALLDEVRGYPNVAPLLARPDAPAPAGRPLLVPCEIALQGARLSLFTTFEQYEGGLDEALSALVMPRLRAHPSAAPGIGT